MHSDSDIYTPTHRFYIYRPSLGQPFTREYFPICPSKNILIKHLIHTTPRTNTQSVIVRLIRCNNNVYEILYKNNNEYILALEAVRIDSVYRILNYDQTYSTSIKYSKKRNIYVLSNETKTLFYVKFEYKNLKFKSVKTMTVYYSKDNDSVDLVKRVMDGEMDKVYVLLSEDMQRMGPVLDLKMFYPLNRNNYVLNVVDIRIDEVVVEYKYPLKIGDVFFFIVSLWNSIVL